VNQKRISIACQGGGSQCAFVAGALKALFERGVHERFEIVGLSGTSGGALTAALAWEGLLKWARGDRTPIEDRIVAFWNDLTAQTPIEIAVDGVSIQIMRLVERGLLPSVSTSPSSPMVQIGMHVLSQMIARPEFTDLRAALVKHMDFDALPSLVGPQSPVLLLGAVDVRAGSFKVFSSAKQEIKVESLLASAAIPNLFPAMWVDGHPYWDGIFSSNPPITGLLRRPWMGHGALPEEIWIIQVNRAQQDLVPELPSDIFDRRNHLSGNLSLQHEIEVLGIWNALLDAHALTEEFRERIGLDATEAVTVRFIRMSEPLQESLDYPSKLTRQPAHIARLMADGEARASAFLSELTQADRSAEHSGDGPSLAVH
jgi:NTE family protein